MAQNSSSKRSIFLSITYAIIVIAAVFIPVSTTVSTQFSLDRTDAIADESLDAEIYAGQLIKSDLTEFPNEWIATAQKLSTGGSDQSALAISLLEKALIEAPDHYQAWALLAFLQRQSQGAYTDQVATALGRSFETCPYCSKSLLRWRFTFVLDNWAAVDEDTRLLAFSGADFLRWYHLDYTYLESVRIDAIARGLPFDAYRRKIDTPARPNEIGLPVD